MAVRPVAGVGFVTGESEVIVLSYLLRVKWFYCLGLLLLSCRAGKEILLNVEAPSSPTRMTGSAFYRQAASFDTGQRDSLAVQQILMGNIPSFLRKMVKVSVQAFDSASGETIDAYYFVTADYLAVGVEEDWARVPLTPMASQQIADSFFCFLPTRKMVDDIYRAATVKLEPLPMFAYRDSTVTMWQHHLMIEGQRKGRNGLTAGHKKDVVISGRLVTENKMNHVAIYGWHKTDGRPIQPLYTGHHKRYVDYSHGTRLVYRTIFINNKPIDYQAVLQDSALRKLLCDEADCGMTRY